MKNTLSKWMISILSIILWLFTRRRIYISLLEKTPSDSYPSNSLKDGFTFLSFSVFVKAPGLEYSNIILKVSPSLDEIYYGAIGFLLAQNLKHKFNLPKTSVLIQIPLQENKLTIRSFI